MAADRGAVATRSLLLVIGLLVGVIVSGLVLSLRPSSELSDFGAFLAAGRAVHLGENPYVIPPDIAIPGVDVTAPNLNAPFSLLLFALLPSNSPEIARRIWQIMSLVAYGTAVLILQGLFPRPWGSAAERLRWWLWPFAFAGLWWTIGLGQLYNLLLLAFCVVLSLLRRRADAQAGVVLGVVAAIKPNFFVCAGLLFVVGRRKAGLVSCAVAAVLNLVAVWRFGPGIVAEWLSAAQRFPKGWMPQQISVWGDALRWSLPPWTAFSLAVFLIGAASVWTWQTRPPVDVVLAVGVSVMLLVSPLAWLADTVWLLPAWYALRPCGSWVLRVSAILLMLPVSFHYVIADKVGIAPLGAAYSLAVACVGVAIILRHHTYSPAGGAMRLFTPSPIMLREC